jgi:hypothetical protein
VKKKMTRTNVVIEDELIERVNPGVPSPASERARRLLAA